VMEPNWEASILGLMMSLLSEQLLPAPDMQDERHHRVQGARPQTGAGLLPMLCEEKPFDVKRCFV
jgi:hypothetical protein